MIDTTLKNIGAYIGFAALSVLAGVLADVHRQIVNGGPFDGWLMLDAAIVVLVPIITNTVLTMKLPSVGHETAAAKVEAHEERLRVTDPPAPAARTVEVTDRG
jgi:hypothetical protein